MDQIVCRFYGRLVVARPRATDAELTKLTFVMPSMTYGNSGLPEHRPLMGVSRRQVSARAGETTLEPTFRLLSDGAVTQSEYFVWDLTGWTVSIGGGGGVSLSVEEDKDLVDLAELEGLLGRNAVLDTANLHGTKTGLVSAAVEVTSGLGFASKAFPGPPSAFATLSSARAGQPDIRRQRRDLVDLIEVAVTADERLRLDFTDERGDTRHVTILRIPEAHVSFTNQCCCMPPTPPAFDFEFTQYYKLLTAAVGDPLIPNDALAGGSQGCDKQAQIRY